jgi:hypothetical protein
MADALAAGEPGLASATGAALAAVMWMQASMTVFQVYGTLNSSPWTTENVGADEEKMASLREYVTHAGAYSSAYLVVAALIGRSWWPVAGAVVNNAYLVWIYRRAAQRGAAAGSKGEGWFGTWGRA